MSYVLSMTTGQIGNPIAYFILMISNNRLLHVVVIPVLDDGVGVVPTIIRYCFFGDLYRSEPTLTFLERQLRSLRGRHIRPVFILILVEAADKDDLPIEMAEFRETCLTAQRIDDARIILPDDKDSPFGRLIDITSAGIARIRKQFGG